MTVGSSILNQRLLADEPYDPSDRKRAARVSDTDDEDLVNSGDGEIGSGGPPFESSLPERGDNAIGGSSSFHQKRIKHIEHNLSSENIFKKQIL